jgi:hypothetical protein
MSVWRHQYIDYIVALEIIEINSTEIHWRLRKEFNSQNDSLSLIICNLIV